MRRTQLWTPESRHERGGRPTATRGRWVRRTALLAVVLVVVGLGVPPATLTHPGARLVATETASTVAHDPDVVWVLFLGSDARPGQPVTRSRADAIQLVGVNTVTGTAAAIGVPRDSYVPIPGHGRGKINSALAYGGPQLMAKAVANMVGITPDYVFTAGFEGFKNLINAIGGITVVSEYAFTDPVMPGGYQVGKNRLNGLQALIFARIRKQLPHGDFDRSANQQRTIKGILNEVRAKADRDGFIEDAVLAVVRNLYTDVPPAELYRLARAAAQVDPDRFTGCVIQGSTGYAGEASVVFPDLKMAHRLADRARDDADLDGHC